MPLQSGSTLLGVFQILEILGEGGMGAVFRALDTLKIPPAAVAIKEFRLSFLPSEEATVLRLESDVDRDAIVHFGAGVHSTFTREKAAELFKREAQILHGFDHPHLPHVSAYFEVGDERYLVMELIEGQDLDRLLLENDDAPLPENQVLAWADQVLDALEYCHIHEIVHRDIKPANIVINLQGDAFLVDFGIARVLNDPDQPNVVGRTAGFSPFEQYVRRGIVDARSDIYSLGATLYNLLTGKVPPLAPLRMEEGQELPSIRTYSPDVSANLEEAVLRALALQPEQRFQSAREMRAAIFGARSTISLTDQPPDAHRRRLYPDGGTDYTALQTALDEAAEDEVVELAPGDYILGQPLKINRPVHLQGAGMEVTRIICYEEETVFTCYGETRLVASGLTFQHKGKAWADVLVCLGGEVQISNCRFIGGVRQAETRLGGSGLCLLGNTKGSIRQCNVYGNGGHGIEVSDWANIQIEDSQCSQNRLAGIVFSGNARGEARHNHCLQNFSGILVSGNAGPTLLENTCSNNRSSGITFTASSSGSGKNNHCEHNQFHGISVIDEAHPILEGNQCSQNKRDGISFSGAARGTVHRNRCRENDRFGLSVNEQANPQVLENECTSNSQENLRY